MELIFAMRLHIPPSELYKMPYYDIRLLYYAYEDYVEKENEETERQKSEQEEKYRDEIPDYKNFNVDKLMSDMTNSNQFKMPSMPAMPSMPDF